MTTCTYLADGAKSVSADSHKISFRGAEDSALATELGALEAASRAAYIR